MFERLYSKDKLLAIIVRSDFQKIGIEFFTPNDFSQQLAYMKRPVDYIIPPHVHNPVDRRIKLTLEVLFIKSGKVQVDYYEEDRTYIKSSILEKGDIILLASGGHGFTMLEESEIIEVKQGPYAGDADKTRFEPVDKSNIVVEKRK